MQAICISTKANGLSFIDEETLTYESGVNYMNIMLDASDAGSDEALQVGTIAELKRNLKITDLQLHYGTTTFFQDYETAEEISSALSAYVATLQDCYVVTATSLNCRQGPGSSYQKVGAFSRGTTVTYLGEDGSWYQVTDGTITGWVYAAYLQAYSAYTVCAYTTAAAATSYSDEDLYWLAVAINMEAGSSWLSDTHQLLVGNVILNRVASSSYPNTVYDVIHQKGQYPWAARGYSEPTERALENARRLLNGERFCPDNVVYQSTVTQGSGTYTSIYDATLGTTTYFCYM